MTKRSKAALPPSTKTAVWLALYCFLRARSCSYSALAFPRRSSLNSNADVQLLDMMTSVCGSWLKCPVSSVCAASLSLKTGTATFSCGPTWSFVASRWWRSIDLTSALIARPSTPPRHRGAPGATHQKAADHHHQDKTHGKRHRHGPNRGSGGSRRRGRMEHRGLRPGTASGEGPLRERLLRAGQEDGQVSKQAPISYPAGRGGGRVAECNDSIDRHT